MPNQTTAATKVATRTTGLQLFGTPSPVGMPVGGRVGCRSLLHILVVQHSMPQGEVISIDCFLRYSSTLLQALVLSRRNNENIVSK